MSYVIHDGGRPTSTSLLTRIAHPPVREAPFWFIQISLIAIVAVHFLADVRPSLLSGSFPTGVPVALLVVPIGYSALRYGLAGSIATTSWTIVLWLPDLLLPHDQGHVLDDVMNLAIIVLVAMIFGRRVEAEHRSQERALSVEAGYRRLFETNRSPILVIDHGGVVSDANPAARELLGPSVIGRTIDAIFDGSLQLDSVNGDVLTLSNGHDYRIDVATIPFGDAAQHQQLNFEDITAERTEERRSREFARQMVQIDEDQRRRLARELHDEPLQLFLHLARRLESLGAVSGVPTDVTTGLDEARRQALDAATRLRTLARDLRPPALDQFGLVPALSSLVAHLDDGGDPHAQLEVNGPVDRLLPDVELGAFRIVQESLNNVVRHAHAHQVRVTINFSPDELHLSIVDDGQGYDTSASVRIDLAPSLGIMGMRERARLLGGSLLVQSTRGVGTAVEASLPLHARPVDSFSRSSKSGALSSNV